MKISWEYSAETEAKRVLHTAHQIAVGFYRLNGFYVLPYSPKNKDFGGNLVYFPDLPYHKIKRFWEKVKRIDIYHLPIQADPKFLTETASLLTKTKLLLPDIDKVQKTWIKVEKDFFKEIERVIPDLKNTISAITVYPTVLGTKCSFSVADKFPAGLTFYLREDEDVVWGLAEAVLTSLTRNRIYTHLEGTWSESEFLVDWLLSESSIGKTIAKHHPKKLFSPTIKSARTKQAAKILEASENFYRKLGLPALEKPFSLNGLTPEINQKPVENLNPREKIFLRTLIQKEGQVVTFDEIADLIYQNESEFSLWALAKLTERLRNKLEANGLSGSYIQTLRGRGYVLKN